MDTANTRHREPVDAPELGASVFIVECSVGEMLPLLKLAESGDTYALMMAALAATLEVDGQRFTQEELLGMGARKLRALMRIGPTALRVNAILPEEDAEKKS